jgi:hypothetical protein
MAGISVEILIMFAAKAKTVSWAVSGVLSEGTGASACSAANWSIASALWQSLPNLSTKVDLC